MNVMWKFTSCGNLPCSNEAKQSIKKDTRVYDPDGCRDISLVSIAEICNTSTGETSFSPGRS